MSNSVFPANCQCDAKIIRIESDLEQVEKRLEDGAKRFDQLLNKLDVMTGALPSIHEKQERYVNDLEKLLNKLEQIESKISNRVDAIEREHSTAIRVTEEKIMSRLQSSLERVHDRQDTLSESFDKHEKKFNWAFAAGVGLWLAVSFAWSNIDPIGRLEKLVARIERNEKEVDGVKDLVLRLTPDSRFYKGTK